MNKKSNQYLIYESEVVPQSAGVVEYTNCISAEG